MAAPAAVTEAPDDTLAVGVLAGDPAALEALFDRYADRLYDLCLTVLRDPDAATVTLRHLFDRLPDRLSRRRERGHLAPWLYASALVEAGRRPRGGLALPQDGEPAEPVAPPPQAAGPALLRELAVEAEHSFSEPDRALLCLHLRHGLDAAELALVTGRSTRRTAARLARLRDRAEQVFGGLLVARWRRPPCAALRRLIDGPDAAPARQVTRHVASCLACAQSVRTSSPLAVLAAVPPVPAPEVLRLLVLNNARLDRRRLPPPPPRRPLGPRVAGGLVAVAIVSAVVVIWWDATGPALPQIAAPPVTAGSAGAPEPGSPPAPPPAPVAPDRGPDGLPAPADPSVPSTAGGAVPPALPTGSAPFRAGNADTAPSPTPAPAAPAPLPGADPAGSLAVVPQAASPASVGVRGCGTDRTTVTAVLSGNPAAALLVWRDAAGGSGVVAMRRSGERWSATLGPFDAPGTVSWQVGAGEPGGATTRGPAQDLPVGACGGAR
jgi:DNA-directed RNA polymerase specialized sigma24 family protein